MKKFLTTLVILTLALVCLFSVSVSAKRTEKTPVTLTQDEYYYSDTLFTITKIKVFNSYLDESDGKKSLDFTLHGYFGSDVKKDGTIKFLLYCYDKKGNHIDTQKFTVSGPDNYEYGSYHYFKVPNSVASFEIASENPASWTNSLFVNKTRKVWSTDGRSKTIQTLLLPNYEKAGWIGDVTLYALDGRSKEVPYPEVSNYKKVGWYDYTTYALKNFRSSFQTHWDAKNYQKAMEAVDRWEYALKDTSYSQELYSNKTKAMDAWRKKINGPLAYLSNYVYQYSGYTNVNISFRNVSYKPIIAFKLKFVCYDVFGNAEVREATYQVPNTNITSAGTQSYTWKIYNSNIKRISTPIITQVVYSDYSSWYR